MEKSNRVSLKACCLARRVAAERVAATDRGSETNLKYPPCRCRMTITTMAMLMSKPWANIGGDRICDAVPSLHESIFQVDSPAQMTGNFSDGSHQVGPPMRKILCRWII